LRKFFTVNRKGDTRYHRANQVLYWKLLSNAVNGVTKGFTKTLKIEGIGYKWAVANNKLTLSVGFSHPVEFIAPKGITLESPAPALLNISGFDRELVGQVAANIGHSSPPEPFKGKASATRKKWLGLKKERP
jgi:large subunit ribosomal protein L6